MCLSSWVYRRQSVFSRENANENGFEVSGFEVTAAPVHTDAEVLRGEDHDDETEACIRIHYGFESCEMGTWQLMNYILASLTSLNLDHVYQQ